MSIWRTARLYMWSAQDAVVNTLGSALAASWLYRAQFLESAAAMILLPIHLAVFLTEPSTSRPGTEIWLLCLMPVILSSLRLPLAYGNYCRCRLIAAMGLEEERLIGALLAHFASRNSRWSCAISAILLPWYFCNVLWCLAALPCSQYSEMFFWEMASEAAPCESFNFTSSFLCCLLTMTFCSRLVMPVALRIRWTVLVHARLRASPSPGLSEEQLQQLPETFEYGDGDARAEHRDPNGPFDPSVSSAHQRSGEDCCSICLDNFSSGERVRRLTCSHLFHQAWLQLLLSFAEINSNQYGAS
ncbi:unnamed protein product [Effrenium voratum]|nr:unnamed protein product [Effrenium voratum]